MIDIDITRRRSARRTAKRLRTAQALVFLGLGGWCLLAPHMVEALSLKPEYQHLSARTALLMAASARRLLTSTETGPPIGVE